MVETRVHPPPDTRFRDVLSQNLHVGDWVPNPDFRGWREVESVLRPADEIVVFYTDGSRFRFPPFFTVRIRR